MGVKTLYLLLFGALWAVSRQTTGVDQFLQGHLIVQPLVLLGLLGYLATLLSGRQSEGPGACHVPHGFLATH